MLRIEAAAGVLPVHERSAQSWLCGHVGRF